MLPAHEKRIKTQIILIFSLIIITSCSSAEAKTISVASTFFPPFSGEDLPGNGAAIEIIRESFKRVGIKTQIKFLPWKRAMLLAQKGEFEGLGPLWHSEERGKLFVFSKGLQLENQIGFFKKKLRQISFTTYEDLKPYIIGYVLDFAYSGEFYKSTAIHNRQNAYNTLDLMRALVTGRIDLALMSKSQGLYLLRIKFPDQKNNYHFMDQVISTNDNYLAVSRSIKNHKSIINQFNTGLEMVFSDGTAKAIRKKHNIE